MVLLQKSWMTSICSSSEHEASVSMGSSESSTFLPAETAVEEGVADATAGGLGGQGARRCSSDALPRGGGKVGAAFYLGLVSSEKVESGGADGDAGSIREGEVDMGAALAFGAAKE